jgi:hypothetical protein
MIFGSKQNKELAGRIVQAVMPSIEQASNAHGLPTGFWKEPYVLGYMMGQINGWMSIMDGDALSIADKGRIVVETFGTLSGEKGKPISENAMVCAQQQNPDFMRGNQNGMFMAMYAAGRVPDADGYEVVVMAREAAGDDSPEAVTEQLARALWVEEVRACMTIGA